MVFSQKRIFNLYFKSSGRHLTPLKVKKYLFRIFMSSLHGNSINKHSKKFMLEHVLPNFFKKHTWFLQKPMQSKNPPSRHKHQHIQSCNRGNILLHCTRKFISKVIKWNAAGSEKQKSQPNPVQPQHKNHNNKQQQCKVQRSINWVGAEILMVVVVLML